jgi:hypothetical protein
MSDEGALREKAQGAWDNVLTLFLIIIGLGSLSGVLVNLISDRLGHANFSPPP